MSKAELKSKFPETYNAIVQEGVTMERQRAKTIIEMENERKKAWDF